MIATDVEPTPAELRKRLGHNLQALSRSAPSISALCRELGINRTQFNRYRAGESFPRPDVLWRICRYFNVDARILLEPVERISRGVGPLSHPDLAEYLPDTRGRMASLDLPEGIWRFVRPSLATPGRYLVGLFRVYVSDDCHLLTGYETRAAMRVMNQAPTGQARRFRGTFVPLINGFATITARHGGAALCYSAMTEARADRSLWIGEARWPDIPAESGLRAVPQVYEVLPSDTGAILDAARACGLRSAESLPDHLRDALRV